jgi:hypothetical protein
MIGKITIGKSFRGCLLYCLNDKQQKQKYEPVMKDRAEILLFNRCYGNQKDLIRQFTEVRQLNPKLAKPVLHITLSLAPGEHLPKNKLMDMCQNCARDLGFENNQFVAIHHSDTSHQHVHIVANRIGFDKRTVSDSQNYQKIAKYCRKMEVEYGLKQVLSPKQFLSKKEQVIPRQDARKEKVKKDIQQSLRQAKSYGDFEIKMKSLGYKVLKGRGISFVDDKKVKIKGSEVGFSLMKLEKIFAVKNELGDMQKIQKDRRIEQLQSTKTGIQISAEDIIKTARPELENVHQPLGVADLEKQLSDLIFGIMKPEHMTEHLAPEWLKKLRQKRNVRRHL